MSLRSPLALLAVAAMTVGLAACTSTRPAAGEAVAVTTTDDDCQVATDEVPSGVVRFAVTNGGSDVSEFYVLAEDGLQVLGEVENIGPGLTRDLVLQAAPGSYVVACRPGMSGDGIRAPLSVTDSGADLTPTGPDAELIATATADYAAYVEDQAQQLLAGTSAFAAAITAGDDDAARSLYAATRMHWERIEPVAESFGDLDPILDAREADLGPGQEWTGWHRLEKDLWPPAADYVALTPAERAALATRLVSDTENLVSRTTDMTFTVDQLGNGATTLLAEVATGKVTGEEEAWSHTDLADFQANIEGARVLFAGLRPLLERRDPTLAATLEERFAAVATLLDRQRDGDEYVPYDLLTPAQVKELAVAVDALAEPLSTVTSTVLSGA
jgi:iron uptake system component EfeO